MAYIENCFPIVEPTETSTESADPLNYLVENGATLETIQTLVTRGTSIADQAAALKEILKSGDKNPYIKPAETVAVFEKGDLLTIEGLEQLLISNGIEVRTNLLKKEIEVGGLPLEYSSENALNTFPVYLFDELRKRGVKGANLQIIVEFLKFIADKNRYNPVEEFLNSGKWDGVDRLPKLYAILGIENKEKEIYQTYLIKWLLQCVALGLNTTNNSVSADGVLVLQGPQGIGKTSFFRKLSPFAGAFLEGAVIDMRVKDSLILATKSWITELGELDSTLKKEQMSLKAFVTLPEDNIRLPYARTETKSPRRTSFCATVNPDEFLKDETGSRRWWIIPVTSIDLETLFSLGVNWINQLWFEVFELYKANTGVFRLTKEEREFLQNSNRIFEASLQYEVEILNKLDFDLPFHKWRWYNAARVAEIIGINSDARKVGRALAKIVKNESYVLALPGGEVNTRRVNGTVEYKLPVREFKAY